MRIAIDRFGAEIPIVADTLLPITAGSISQNCNMVDGVLSSFRALLKDEAVSLTAVKSLFQYKENDNENWVVSANELHFAKSPVAGDQYERVYFTGESEPRFFANDNVSSPFDAATDYLKLGIPAPTTALVLSTSTQATTYRAYVYSYVNSYGDEGPPSPVGSITDYDTGYVGAFGFEDVPANRAIDRIYLYRTSASSDGTAEFQYVLSATWFSASVQYEVGDYVIASQTLYKCTTQHLGVFDGNNFAVGENVADADLLSIFPKTNYDPPPAGLKGLIPLPNGGMAGYVGNQLYLSEPGFPHAWPTDYVVGLDSDIVGIGAEKLRITVVTESNPYVVYGQHPSNVTRERSSTKYPGLDTRGVVSGGGGVFFVTRQGIVFSGLDGFVNATETLMDGDDLSVYNPTSLALYYFDSKLFAFDSITSTGFIIDLAAGRENGRFVPLNVYGHAGFVTDNGYFYLVVDDTSVIDEANPPANMPLCVSQWEGNTNSYLFYTWRSKSFILEKNVNFNIAMAMLDQQFYTDAAELLDLQTLNAATFAAGLEFAIGDNEIAGGAEVAGDSMISQGDLGVTQNVSFKFYVNNVLFKEKIISETECVFRLPGIKTYRRCFFELTGTVPVRKIVIATSVDEI